jgi:hypothetical protein
VLNGDSLASSGAGAATRPLYVGRNTVRTPAVYQFDARYSRTFFKIKERIAPSFFIEANNIFNHPNITTINAVATVIPATGAISVNPTFAPVSTLLEGRIMQLGVRVNW